MFKATLFTLLLFSLGGCSSTKIKRANKRAKAAFNDEGRTPKKLNVKFFKQQEKECGPTSLYTILNYYKPGVYGIENIKHMTMTPGFDGAMKRDLLAAARRSGFAFYPVYTPEDHLIAIEDGEPVLVFQNLGLGFSPTWHFSVVTGYSKDPDQIFVHDGKTPHKKFTPSRFFKAWYRGKKWSYIVVPPEHIPKNRTFREALDNASAFLNLGDLKAARKILNAADKRWPKRFEIYAGLGNAYASTDVKKALLYYDKALLLKPGHLGLINNRNELRKIVP